MKWDEKWDEWLRARPGAEERPHWWPTLRYWTRAVWSVLWISAATHEVLVLLFSTSTNKNALVTNWVLQIVTSSGALSFLAGALVARFAIPYQPWEPWPPPPWWGIVVVLGTFAGLALIDFFGQREVPFAVSGAFGTIVGHLFISKCLMPDGRLTDCEEKL